MQYRYGANFFATERFEATKAKLRNPPPFGATYGGRFMALPRIVKFRLANGGHVRTAGLPLYTRNTRALYAPADTPVPRGSGFGAAVPPAAAASSGERYASTPEKHRSDIGQETGLKPSTSRISTPAMTGLLSVAVAIAAGIVIASNDSFKLNVTHGSQAGELLADTTATPKSSASVLPAKPPAALTATVAASAATAPTPSLQAKPRTSNRHAHKTGGATRKKPVPAAADGRIAHRAPQARNARMTRQTRQSLPSPGVQYARCTQLDGFLRRERCKWQVCSGKWGEQGCPSYQ